jgi:hypothetical protein
MPHSLPRSLRHLVLVTVVAVVVWTATRQVADAVAVVAPEFPADYADRFVPIRAALPTNGTAGFVTATAALRAFADPANATFRGMSHGELSRKLMLHYLLTQQAVAPLFLVFGDQHDVLVGNFLDEALVEPLPDYAVHRVAAVGAHGVRLFVRKDR